MSTTLSTKVTTPVYLGPGYDSAPLTITSTGVIAPTFPADAVYSRVPNASVTNYGSVYGGNGSAKYTNGGTGISLHGGQVFNSGVIQGGSGYDSSYMNGYYYRVGSAGAGVFARSAAQLNNEGQILGGSGGSNTYGNFTGAVGAAGVLFTDGGQVSNSGTIGGGSGGEGYGYSELIFKDADVHSDILPIIPPITFSFPAGVGGDGGAGVQLGATANLSNSGIITGGYAGEGNAQAGTGGAGVSQNDGHLYNIDGGVITGGEGGIRLFGLAGTGGVGVSMIDGSVTNTGASLQGGAGGASLSTGGVGGAGVNLGQGSIANTGGAFIMGGTGGLGYGDANGASVSGGAGGDGIDLSHGSVTNSNYSVISGGTGGYIFVVPGFTGITGHGGAGGTGVDLLGVGTVTNAGTIEGGAGGSGNSANGAGGVGVDLGHGGKLINTGTISGGDGSVGGVGVYLNDGTLFTSGTISGGLGTTLADAVQFGPADSSMVVEPGAVFDGAIGGFAIGDVIDVTNLTPSQVEGDVHGDTIAMGGSGTLDFTGIPSGDFFHFASYGPTGTQITLSTTPCYRRGTRILAERGEVPIESLKMGDRVMTSSGIMRPIRWIGRRSYSGEAAWGNREVLPIRIGAGALGDGLPRRDLWVSPEHAMFIEGLLIPASLLVNGASIVQEESVDEVTYLHLEFDSHTVIYAEGAAAESFVDDESRAMFDNAADYARLYPNAAREPARFCAPRTEDGEALEAVRRRLAARAGFVPVMSAEPRRNDGIASRA